MAVRRALLAVLVVTGLATPVRGGRGQIPPPSPVPSNGPPGPIVRPASPPGWNPVAAPPGAGFPTSTRPIYTYQSAATGYQTVPAGSSQPGLGYWVYYEQLMPASFPGGGLTTFSRTLTGGQWTMVGNPLGTIALVSGADALYVY